MALLLPVFSVFAQQTQQSPVPREHNHVVTRTYRAPVVGHSEVQLQGQCLEDITYFDGLGRPIQQVSAQRSPLGRDMVTHVGYDQYGRQVREYMPYPADGTPGSYRTGARPETEAFYGQWSPMSLWRGPSTPTPRYSSKTPPWHGS